MSCDRRMRQVAKAAAASGISPIASQSAYALGTMSIYAEMLRTTDIQNFDEMYNYFRYGKLPSPKKRTTGNYVLAGITTAAVLAKLRKQKRLAVKKQQTAE